MADDHVRDEADEPHKLNAIEIHREMAAWQIEVYRVAYTNSRNPVFVWKALKWLKPLPSGCVTDGESKVALPPQVPDWCMEYLIKCADDIDDLSFGIDPRYERTWEDLGKGPDLDEGQAAQAIPSVFGFLSPGWNAFKEYRSLRETYLMEKRVADLRESGLSAAKAMGEALEFYRLEDERSFRRRIARRNRVFGPADDDEPEQGQT
jgi:hypothetical protein